MRYGDFDVGTQTKIGVYPHIIKTEDLNKVRVYGNAVVQTVTTIGKNLDSDEIENLLVYTPFNRIIQGALYVTDIPKKSTLTFNETVIKKSIEEEASDRISMESDNDNEQLAFTFGVAQGKSNLKHREEDNPIKTIEGECQTDLMVRPYILTVDDVAHLYHNVQTQTLSSFSPETTIEQVTNALYGVKTSGEINNFQNKQGTGTKEQICIPCSTKQKAAIEPESDQENEQIGTALKKLTSDEIQEICNGCYTEAQVLNRIRGWYREVHSMLNEDSEEENDCMAGNNFGQIEAEILANQKTADALEIQLNCMEKQFYPVETQDISIQAQQAYGKKERLDQSCSCAIKPIKDTSTNLQNFCDKATRDQAQHAKGRGRNVTSCPSLVTCVYLKTSDLTNETKRKSLPIKARACTNRKCNCLHSEGCLHCEQALRIMKRKQNSSTQIDCPPCKTTNTNGEYELLADIEEDDIDEYMKLLQREDDFTQVDEHELEKPKRKTSHVCTCANAMLLPWDMLALLPAPQKKVDDCTPQEQKKPEETDNDEEGVEDEKKSDTNCRKRPPRKPYQVYDPEVDEAYNEAYMERIQKLFSADDDEGICTSHIEMPWNEIELPKIIRLRKGIVCQPAKKKVSRDPKRKCGPEDRARRKSKCKTNEYKSKSNIKSPRPQIPAHKGASDPCICNLQNTTTPKCKTCKPANKSSNSMSGAKKPFKIVCSRLASELSGAQSNFSKTASAQSRTERIAALLDSCKKEMEPIKDGINELRARIKELNIPDLVAYQEKPQHPYNPIPPTPGYDMYAMQHMQMPMCYSPMCYIPSCMQHMSNMSPLPNMPQPIPKSNKKCNCASQNNEPLSNNMTTSRSTSPSARESNKRNPDQCDSEKEIDHKSSSKLTCACALSISIPPVSNTSRNSNGTNRSKIPRPVGQQSKTSSECNCGGSDNDLYCRQSSTLFDASSSKMIVMCQGTQCEKASNPSEPPKKPPCNCSGSPNPKKDTLCKPCGKTYNVNFS